jgi:hypothetical protein
MESRNINVGDKLYIKSGFNSDKKPLIVTILSKENAQAEGGYLFKTFPGVGTNGGLSCEWFEVIDTNNLT